MHPTRGLSLFVGATLICLGLTAASLRAQGRIIIEPPVRPAPRPGPGQTKLILKALNVHAEITDGVAVTTVSQTFQNPHRRQVEGVYIFPLPDDVAVGEFSMTVNGKTLHGEVLDADTARKTYEDIVRRMRDPGLLEYLGSRLFRARIFPIPPRGQVDVRLNYSQTLTEQAGLGLYRHPLRSGSQDTHTIDRLAVSVKLKSTLPLTTVFSPSHECDLTQPSDHEATVSYEATRVRPERDFLLYYQRKDATFGLALLTHRGAGEPGTFLLRVSPRVELDADQVLPKDIAFVIDTSGSMAGDKLAQAKRALTFCINNLGRDDRFNIYAFSSEVHPFRDRLVPANDDIKQAATDFADKLKSIGGTNIDAALRAALEDDPRDEQRVYLIVFLTDGQPTVGITDPQQIRDNVMKQNSRQVRFHVLGVGSDVNTHLLDKLAEATRGARDYCTEREDLELKLSNFVMRLAHPVLTDLILLIDGVQTSSVYPQQLPDLFRGNDLVVLGRYEGHGPASVRLKGNVRGGSHTIGYEGVFSKIETANDFLPRLWANRKVAYLLDQIRLHGRNKELIDEVVRLAKRYGIVTPYTSALILEDGTQVAGRELPPGTRRSSGGRSGSGGMYGGGRTGGVRRGRAGGGSTSDAERGGLMGPDKAVGQGAVLRSRELQYRKLAEVAPDASAAASAGSPAVRHVGDKAFMLVAGRWTDTTWDQKTEPHKITAFSDEYFELLAQHEQKEQLKKYLSLGDHLLIVLADRVYEIVPPEQQESSDE